MSLQNKQQSKARGFTIVELLIVIVVIGILAAITIVAYNGIQNRARSTAAQQAASNVSKKAEAYNAELSYYPQTSAAMTGATSDKTYYLTGTSFAAITATAPTNGPSTVSYERCAEGTSTATNTVGARIIYYNYTTGAATTSPILIGTTTGNGPGGTAVTCTAGN